MRKSETLVQFSCVRMPLSTFETNIKGRKVKYCHIFGIDTSGRDIRERRSRSFH